MQNDYTYVRRGDQFWIYDRDGTKMAECVAGNKNESCAKKIVKGLNMRQRWLERTGKIDTD